MDIDLYIDAFATSTEKVMTTMASTELRKLESLVRDNRETMGEVTGVIGFSTEEVTGNLIISFEEQCILKIVERMVGAASEEINEEIIDAVGELTNIIVGGAKSELNKHGHISDMARPMVIAGKGTTLSQVGEGSTIIIPYVTQNGKFFVEVGMAKKPG